jgi:hypothetical protein
MFLSVCLSTELALIDRAIIIAAPPSKLEMEHIQLQKHVHFLEHEIMDKSRNLVSLYKGHVFLWFLSYLLKLTHSSQVWMKHEVNI